MQHYTNDVSIISLNTWGGLAGLPGLLAFVKRYRDTTDIFCLQEVCNTSQSAHPFKNKDIVPNLLEKFARLLPSHEYFFTEHTPEIPGYGMAIFASKRVNPRGCTATCISRHQWRDSNDDKDHTRMLQHLTCSTQRDKIPFSVMNVHALWDPSGKGDCLRRTGQTRKILNIADAVIHPVIIAGDFNLLPHTQALRTFEQEGFRNLITDYGITDTRTKHYTKPDRYADYVLVRGDTVAVRSFEVLPEPVSDHAALRLVCEISS